MMVLESSEPFRRVIANEKSEKKLSRADFFDFRSNIGFSKNGSTFLF